MRKYFPLKNSKGITLIVLVITIIVLLVLAGVSLSLMLGQNGVLKQAQNATTETRGAEEKEKIEMAVAAARAVGNGELTEENLDTELGKVFDSGILKKRKSRILPEEYQQVEYIESTGTEYIDTGFKPNSENVKIELKIQVKNSGYGYAAIGADDRTNNDACIIFDYRTQEGYNRFYMGISENTPASVQDYNLKTLTGIFYNGEYKIYKNNEMYCSGTYNGTIQTTNNWWIYKRNPYDQGTGLQGKLYYLNIDENNNKIRNFIPCYRKSDNKPGLYDTVTGQFYTNQGTGEFLKGKNIVLNETPGWNYEIGSNKKYVIGLDGKVDYINQNTENYIEEGLVLRYDGIENTRAGNNPNATEWEDLSGNENDGIFSNAMVSDQNSITQLSKGYYSPEEKGYVFLHNDAYIKSTNNIGISGDENYTVEVVIKPWEDKKNSNYSCYRRSEFLWWGSSSTDIRYSTIFSYNRNSNKFIFDYINNGVYSDEGYDIINKKSYLSFRKIKNGIIKNGDKDVVKINYNDSIILNTYTGSVQFTPDLINSKVEIGRAWQWNGENRPFYGSIQSIRIYDRVLTDEEVQNNYQLDKKRFNIE